VPPGGRGWPGGRREANAVVDSPPFERLGIIGLGLVGGSVALAAKRRWPDIRITVCDPAPVTAEAVSQGLAHSRVESPAELAACDLIVVATPVHVLPEVLSRLAQAGTTALVTDVSSTKRFVIGAAARAGGLAFAGGHPVVTSTSTGLAAARADLFDGKAWLLVSASSDEAVREAMLTSFVVGLGGRPEWTDAVTHDRVMAHVTHAPHVVSMALATAEAAGEPDQTWQGIMDTNADFISDAVAAIAARLPTSGATLTDTPVVRDLFDRARRQKAGEP